MQTLSYFPGQEVTIFLDIQDGYHVRTDLTSLPIVTRVIFPAMTLAANYPQLMIKLDTGLFYHKFVLPTGATAVGSYLVDISYINPFTSQTSSQSYQVVVTAPFGNFNATASI